MQRHSVARPSTDARKTVFRDRSKFYCLPLIEFPHALVDYEAQSVTIKGTRYLFDGIAFSLVVALLIAESAFVPRRVLLAEIGLISGPTGTVQLCRLIRQIRERLAGKNQAHLIEVRRDAIRIVL
jgi:DNA-binding response OmpR family regulator